MDDSFVKNAADPKQVKAAEKRQKNITEQYELDLKSMLGSKSGRNVLWHLLCKCRVFETVRSGGNSPEAVYANIGLQDFGHYIMAEIVRIDESALFQMMQDNKQTIIEGGSQ